MAENFSKAIYNRSIFFNINHLKIITKFRVLHTDYDVYMLDVYHRQAAYHQTQAMILEGSWRNIKQHK